MVDYSLDYHWDSHLWVVGPRDPYFTMGAFSQDAVCGDTYTYTLVEEQLASPLNLIDWTNGVSSGPRINLNKNNIGSLASDAANSAIKSKISFTIMNNSDASNSASITATFYVSIYRCDRLSPTTAFTSATSVLLAGDTPLVIKGEENLLDALIFSDYRYEAFLIDGETWCDTTYSTSYSITNLQDWMTFDSSPREPTLTFEIDSVPSGQALEEF